ncbi:MAG: DUF1343 domain-containing protein [candidate division KSB1 bacterium]|nr:DUF1343 domain-containing protein [candidate division KSB1 bacterium]
MRKTTNVWLRALRCLVLAPLLPSLLCASAPRVKPGVEVLIEKRQELLRGRRVGLITNPTGVTSDLRSTIDVLNQLPGVKLVALFGPEHGVRGDVFAGEHVGDFVDARTGLPVYSLYGRRSKPTPEMLADVDVLVYDVQDIGSRTYTYIYTMASCMEAAAERGIPFVVLDRPNPLGGLLVEGPVLEHGFESGIGRYPIPYVYGLTVGELAMLFNKEFGINCQLTVVPMEGWRRAMLFADTGLPWVPTSPHIPHAETAIFYPATGCLGELGVCEGVGYTLPFELVGDEWTDGQALADHLNQLGLPGVVFRPQYFRPYYFRYKDKQLHGVQIHLTDPRAFRPMATQMHILAALRALYPQVDLFARDRYRPESFDRAMGTDAVRKALAAGQGAEEIMRAWQPPLERFMKVRERYLLYR